MVSGRAAMPARERITGALALLHPGPSLLVTALFVAAASVALRAAPAPSTLLRLVALMLPAQFAIGIVNDVCDRAEDARHQPAKPLVRGAVGPGVALASACILAAVSLTAAASFGVATLAATAAGLAAGLLYDAGLKRSPLSTLAWALGFTALPVAAFAAAGRWDPGLLTAPPLAILLALALHCANGAPDAEGDRAGGHRSLPARLGPARARTAAIALTPVAAAAAVLLMLLTGELRLPLLVGAAVATAAAATLVPLPRIRPFPLLAPAAGALALGWMLCLR